MILSIYLTTFSCLFPGLCHVAVGGGVERGRFLMSHDEITMQFTPAERSLLLRYGYPFSQSEAALKACAESRDIEHVPIDRFNLEQLIGNLCHSIKRAKPGKLRACWITRMRSRCREQSA